MIKNFSQLEKTCYSNSKKWAYIPIAKCASIFGTMYFTEGYDLTEKQDWSSTSNKDKNFIIFLRDPIKRWLSGVSEFIYQEQFAKNREIDLNNETILYLIFNGVRFDIHTTPQIYFLEGLNLANCYFFDIDNPNFIKNLNFFCHKHFGYKSKIDISNQNVTKENIHKKEIYNRILEVYNNDQSLHDAVHNKLIPDMHFITHLGKTNKII